MPSILENLLFSFIDLLRQTLILGIGALLLCWVGQALFVRLRKTRSWLFSMVLSTYMVVFALIILAYFGPYVLGAPDFIQGPVPEPLAQSTSDLFLIYLGALARSALVAAALCALLLPLEFLASAVDDLLKPRLSHAGGRFVITVFATTFVALLLLLFVLPAVGINLVAGLLYLLYFA
jgi:hypothetical protein